jgi:hypothetical protein
MKKYTSLRATAHAKHADYSLVKRAGDILDWQTRCVCETHCNNGWMRRLDERARPILIPLVKGEVTRVSPDSQRVIAAWASMKAMVAEYDESGVVTTHHTQRKRMMLTQLPPERGWATWIGNFVRKRWPGYWSGHPFLVLPDEQVSRRSHRRATYYNSQATTQVVGQLFIHILRSPMHRLAEKWRFSLPAGVSFFRIWPPSDYSISWPGGTMGDSDADYVAHAIEDYMAKIEARRLAEESTTS